MHARRWLRQQRRRGAGIMRRFLARCFWRWVAIDYYDQPEAIGYAWSATLPVVGKIADHTIDGKTLFEW